MTTTEDRPSRIVELAVEIVASHVRRTSTRAEDFGALLSAAWRGVRALQGMESGEPVAESAPAAVDRAARPEVAQAPAERLRCLDDGRDVVFLGRHLRSIGTTEEDYRRRWSLPDDHPMTAPAYVERARTAARRTGFGVLVRPDREVAPSARGGSVPAPEAPPPRRRRGTLAPAYH